MTTETRHPLPGGVTYGKHVGWTEYGRQETRHVVDSTFGGDIVYRRHGYHSTFTATLEEWERYKLSPAKRRRLAYEPTLFWI